MAEILNIDRTGEFASFEIQTTRDESFNVFLEFDVSVSDEWKQYFSAIYQVEESEFGDTTVSSYRPVGAAIRPETELRAVKVRIVVQTLNDANGNGRTTVPAKYVRLSSRHGRDVFIRRSTPFLVISQPDPAVTKFSEFFLIQTVVVATPVTTDNSLKLEPKCWKLMNCKAWRLGRLNVKTRRLNQDAEFVLTYNLSELQNELNDAAAYAEVSNQFVQIKNKFEAQAAEQIAAYYVDPRRNVDRFEFTFPYKSYNRINFNFSAQTAELLQDKVAHGARLLVPASVKFVEENVESETAEFYIEIMPQTSTDGVLAIDCGTSSCVAYLYDPNKGVDASFNAPAEQVAFLAKHMKDWVIKECTQAKEPAKKLEWRSLVVNVLNDLQANFKNDQNLEEFLKKSRCFDPNDTNVGLFKFLFQLEKVLRSQAERSLTDPVKRGYYVGFVNRFYEIYEQSFEQYAFSESKLDGIPLGEGGTLETKSEFKYEGIDSDDKTPHGKTGEDVAAERKIDQGNFQYWNANRRIYEQNPKELIHSIYRVDSEEHKRYYAFLKAVVDKAMKGYSSKKGRFLPRILATYPATLLSESRRELKEMFLRMGFPQVDLSYDESVAPAIFYLDKMCGYFDDYGPEAFKTCCTRIGDVWRHNLLVVDVGAGTTDVSVIQVEMKETYPVDNGASGYVPGGRNYEITPWLLGASGNPQVAGNFLTLKIFYRLKALLVAYKLAYRNAGNTAQLTVREQDFIANIVATERIDLTEKNRDEVKKTLDMIEDNMSTRYLNVDTNDGTVRPVDQALFSARYKLFNVLWETAEKLKIKFSEQIARNNKADFNLLDLSLRDYWTEIFGTDVPLPTSPEDSEALVFKFGDFNILASNVASKICEIACNLTKEALRVREKNYPELKEACQGVDSIILSGCSSRLPQMKKAFEDAIRESITQVDKRFATSRTKILFEDQYAKSATAVGALRGANVKAVAPIDVNGATNVVQGFCSRRIDVENLAFFLPADFKSGTNVFFEMQTQFEPVGLLNERSIFSDLWNTLPVGEIQIDKAIGENSSHPNFATLSNSEIQGEVKEELQQDYILFDPKKTRFSLEINSEQDIFALLARTDANGNPQLARTTLIPGLERPYFDNVYQPLMREIDSNDVQEHFQVVGGQIKLTSRLKVCNGGQAEYLTFHNETNAGNQYEALIDQRCYLDEDYQNGIAYCTWFEPGVVGNNGLQTRLTIDYDRQKPEIQTEGGDVLASFDLDVFYRLLTTEEYAFDLKSTKFNVMLCVKLKPDGRIDKAQFNLFVGKRPQFAPAKNYRQWLDYEGLVYRKRINTDIQPRQSDLNPFTGLH